MVKKDTLKGIYLFQDLTEGELNQIAEICRETEVTAGQEIFFTGQAPESFYVIQQGTVKISTTTSEGDEIKITQLATGGHFGEIPFLTGDKRTATAAATETSFLIEIPYDKLRALLEKETKISDRFHRALSKFLAARLRTTTGDLSQARETMMRHF